MRSIMSKHSNLLMVSMMPWLNCGGSLLNRSRRTSLFGSCNNSRISRLWHLSARVSFGRLEMKSSSGQSFLLNLRGNWPKYQFSLFESSWADSNKLMTLSRLLMKRDSTFTCGGITCDSKCRDENENDASTLSCCLGKLTSLLFHGRLVLGWFITLFFALKFEREVQKFRKSFFFSPLIAAFYLHRRQINVSQKWFLFLIEARHQMQPWSTYHSYCRKSKSSL